MGLSIAAYARHRGVSHVAVLKAIKSGRIQKEVDGTIDPIKADAAWKRNTNIAQQRVAVNVEDSGDTKTTLSGPSFAQSRAIREAYNARLAKLDFEERSGSLVKIDSVKVTWFDILRVLRDRALSLPDRLSPSLAGESDPKKIRDLLDQELRQILTDAADAIVNITDGQGS